MAAANNIIYLDNASDLQAEQLLGFFVGWPNKPNPNTLLTILKGSAHIVLALDTASNRVVGFANCISDGVLSAYIPLLEVLPEYQNHGIGKRLISELLDRLKDYYMVDVVCDEELLPFYRKFGLAQSTAAIRRNYARQSGRTS